jgi:hypothetical protein
MAAVAAARSPGRVGSAGNGMAKALISTSIFTFSLRRGENK